MREGSMGTAYSRMPAAPLGPLMKSLLISYCNYCIVLVAEEYEDGKPSSTLLIYFGSVLGISIDGLTFERPSDYTPKLSGLRV
jgi:hypothetical protein